MDVLSRLHVVKSVICGVAIVMLLVCWLIERRKSATGKRWFDLALGVLAIIAAMSYFDFGYYPKFGRFLNPHDFFHYYMGAKYYDELGYLNLYPGVVIASRENHGKVVHPTYRRMEDYSIRPGAEAERNAAALKGAFTEPRWAEFRRDCQFFENLLGTRRWSGVVTDKGYNATPIWNMPARFLTNRLPLTQLGNLYPLMLLDILMISIMVLLTAIAFGFRTGAFLLIFFCTCFSMGYTHARGGFLRLDWVTMVVMSVALIKMGNYKTTGAVMAYAGMARLFPLAFGFGLGAKLVWDTYRERKVNRRYIEYFVTFAGTALFLVVLSIVLDGGLHQWREFFAKIRLHDHDISGMRVGFKYVFLGNWQDPTGGWTVFEQAQLAKLDTWKWLWWMIQAGVLGLSFFAVRNLDDYEALAYSYVPVYFLTAPTFYYQVMVIVPFMFFLSRRAEVSRLTGAIGMFIMTIVLFRLSARWGINMSFSFTMSFLLLVMVGYMMGISIGRPKDLALPTPAQS